MSGRRKKSTYWGGRILNEAFPKVGSATKKAQGYSPTFNHEWFQIVPVLVFVGIVVGVGVLLLSLRRPEHSCAFKIPKPTQTSTRARLTECVELEVARTDSALVRGLTGRTELPRQQGLLLDFGEEGQPCIWMKEMRFNIDAAWLDATGKVIYVQKNIKPDSYPHKFCGTAGTRYIMEVGAGILDAGGIRVGQTLEL